MPQPIYYRVGKHAHPIRLQPTTIEERDEIVALLRLLGRRVLVGHFGTVH